jgi:hypothetical protein
MAILSWLILQISAGKYNFPLQLADFVNQHREIAFRATAGSAE